MKLIKKLKSFKYHLWYYKNISKRFSSFKDLPKLSKEEKKAIKKAWPGLSFFFTDWVCVRAYKKIHQFSPYYLPPASYNELRSIINPRNQLYALENKAMLDLYYPECKFPDVFLRRINGEYYDEQMNHLDEAKAIDLIKTKKEFVIKPSIGTNQGVGVLKINMLHCSGGGVNLVDIFKHTGKNFIVQDVLSSCDEIQSLNETSLNCFRITTIYMNGKFSYSSALKIGRKGAERDNWNCSYWVRVNDDGRLDKYGYDYDLNKVTRTDNGICFDEVFIPSYQKMIKFLSDTHKRLFANCAVVGWDVTIDKQYDVRIVEINLSSPGTNIEQYVGGPIFEPYNQIINILMNRR